MLAMEGITIHINRLGAIRDSVVKLKPIMIFSGESGLGKSYMAMLCHYVFIVLWIRRDSIVSLFKRVLYSAI